MQEELLDSSYIESQELNYAKSWKRFLALFIDGLVYSLFGKILIFSDYNIFVDVIDALLVLLYKPTMEYMYGATLGKMVFKIKVVSVDLQNASLKQVILRNLFDIMHQTISLLILATVLDPETLKLDMDSAFIPGYDAAIHEAFFVAFVLLDVIVYIFNTKHQALHDIMAKTYVIQT